MRSLASIGEEGSNQNHVVYLPSQSLFSSSLQEDITCFDFSMYNVRNEDRMKEVMNKEDGGPSTVRLELEEDSLNNHESMSVLISVIKHLCKTFPSNTAKEQRPKPPQWMEHLRASLTAPDQPDNCRAFIVKLILNCQSHFKEYAHFWISPIIQCVIDNCFGVEMNYLVHDIVRMFYNWRAVAVPDSRIEDELKASEFLRILVMRSDNEQGIIARYNVEVVRIVVTMWKRIVQVPYQELLDLLRPSVSEDATSTTGRAVVDVGISLADVFIVNNILPFNQTGKTTYYEYLLVHHQRADKKVYEPCATVIGRILSVLSKDGELQGEDLEFFHKVVECINPGKGMENDKFITCLHKIQAWYPEIVKGFEAQCISLMNLPSIFSVKTLEILTTALKFDFRHEAFSMITGLPRMVLDESNPDRQVAALELIKELQPHLTPSQMKQLFPAVVSVRNHKRVETRNVVYEIVSWIYDNYRHMADEDAVAQVKEAKLVLISGMVDPDQKLQKKYHTFWNSNDRLSSRGWGRLVDILRLLYSPSCEAAFLTISTTLLLDLCGQTDEYNRTIFDQPLSACKFEYNVSGSFRTQHATFVPMFANTLASQINSLSLGSFEINFQIRATQEPSPSYSSTLQPSLPISSVQDQSLYSFAGPSTSKAQFGTIHKPGSSFGSDHLVTADNTDGEPNTLRLPTRLLLNKDKLRHKYAERNRQQSAQVQRHKAERQKRSENDVTLMRDYRRGDLPDIQIPCSDVVIALRSLAKRDQLIARQLLVAIYKALVDTNVNTDLSGVSSAVDDILQTSTSHEPSLIATMLEMGLVRPSECRSPASIIAEVSKNSHQMSVGALLVEAKLMSEETLPPPHKRVRVNHDINYNDWMYLAEIYHSLEEKDVVQGLFEDKIAEACSRDVREALQAEDQQRWKKAQKKYTECLQSNSGTAAENFLYEASFKCCAHLSEWKELNKSLKETQLHNNLEQVWDDNWKQDHLLPWLFLSEIHYTQTTNVLSVTKDFNSALKCWLEDPTKKAHIESKLADMLSLLLVVNGDVPRAKLVSDASVMQFLAVWQQLDCLNNNLRGSHLLNVHRLMDTDRFLELASDVDRSKKVFRLVEQWKKSSPSKTDNLVSWETQSVYRNIYAKKIEDDLKREGNPTTSIHQLRTHNYLKTLDCALKQKNFYVARRYLDKCKYEMKGSLDNRLLLCNSKVKLLRAELERNELDCFSTDQKKNEIFNSQVEHIMKAWDPLDKLREQDASGLLDHPLNIELHFHTAEVYQTLLAVAQQRPSGLDNLESATVEKLRLELGDGSVEARLKHRVVDCLGQAVAAAEKRPPSECDVLADAYLKLTVFCHEIDDSQYRDKLIQSLLRSMKYGSKEARILFPCLLDTSLADHRDLFMSEYKQVPEWMFLSWVAQLLAHLDTEVGHVVAPLLVDLAKTYPAALQFPFHLSKEMYQYKHHATRDTVNQLSDLLKMDQTTSDLLSGLSCVCQPHGCLMYHIEMLRTVLTQNLGSDAFNEAYELMKKEAFPPKQDDKIKGIAFNSVQKLTDELESLYSQYMNKTTSTDEFIKQLGTLYMKARNDKKKFKGFEMAAYSPWLMNGYKGNVEIPGQYTGQSRPLPNHHVTISSFNRFVKSQDSLRSPIKITILGNDAKEHPFLVKFGEDLRQDQRIQQLFGLMNQLLSADVTASRRQLSVHTYGVVPLNNRFGIIQWVEKTTTLKDFMTSAVPIENIDAAQHIYHRQHFGRFENDSVKFYKRVEREDSIKMYNLAVNKLPTFMLRDAVLRLSISPEAFMHLRSTMLTDHSCLSICQWLLGIGDRHPSNTLVCKDTGRLLGIDFGHAFGTATQLLSVPELMPFRLTPQLLNLAAPFQTTGLIKESMVHTLRVLRENMRLLLATMTVFILEPSVDWMKAARKHVAYMADEPSETGDWFPQLKISLARRKLEGANPRRMVEEDLRLGHQTKPHYDNLLRLLYDGTDDGELRDELSPRHQVECLIDHATNKHILSKTWSGWGSWM
ncbi:DNA-dependent protein kinase catalytic subunit-like isoform X2 [Macrosteles quadrilineatus]|uniref:DNA-dependent protein kinase catalytic subunit-like isoform X2 n=1 Tax=Macrosteles quadrilineatus TaxID=74068 RepID=UPI0023E33BD5|nr:DNA-dependent protein kinase catalytic subunit-like isoform X2 [Macrosteles quadrilineatus]